MQLVLLGPPGSGKGTQAKLLAQALNVPHVSTGDIFRKNLSEGTELGRTAQRYLNAGTLVPDDITERMVRGRLEERDAELGFILDGFPRNVSQGEHFGHMLDELGRQLTAVIYLRVRSSVLIERITGRRACPNCGATYHIAMNPPRESGICDVCGTALVQRQDDSEETVSTRLQVYESETAPLVALYQAQGLLAEFDGEQSVSQITAAVEKYLEAFRD